MFDSASSLDEILGVAIGFSTIMLLLSLVVTAIIQIVQNLLFLRFKNLSLGIFTVLKKFTPTENITLLNVKESILKNPFENTSWILKVFNKKQTWIEPDALVKSVEAFLGHPLNQKQKNEIKNNFIELYGFMQKRFLALTRFWSVLFAVLIAFAFQVDSFDLLRKLSSDPELRMKLEQTARGLTADSAQIILAPVTYEDVSDSALVLLQSSYPDLAQQIEQASGIGPDRDAIIQELTDIMTAEMPDKKDEVIDKYGDLLNDIHKAELDQGLERYTQYSGQLALFDIKPFGKDWNYYWNLQNMLGMLMTAIFLTFGAPFWFNRLHELIKLKDALRPKDEEKTVKDKNVA